MYSLFRDFTIYSAMDPLSIHYRSTLYSLWIHHLFTMDQLYIHCGFTIYLPWIHYFFSRILCNNLSAQPSLKYLDFEFSTKNIFWVEAYVYCIQLDRTDRFDSFLTSSTRVWPLMKLYDLIYPQIVFNFNPRQTSESKHMYIGYISNTPPDLTQV